MLYQRFAGTHGECPVDYPHSHEGGSMLGRCVRCGFAGLVGVDDSLCRVCAAGESGNVALTVAIMLLVVLPAAIFVASVLSDVAEVLKP